MNIFNSDTKARWGYITFLILIIAALVSCEDNPSNVRTASAPPVLDRVSLINKDSTTSQGTRGAQYQIIGKNLESTRSVSFNGQEAEVNLALATDHNLIIAVPDSTPFRNASDELVVANSAGSDSIHFHIIQPPPQIKSFNPKSGAAGSIVTLKGIVFDGVDSVLFGNRRTGKLAQIVSSSQTQIKVKVPEGVTNAPITVITPGGSAVTATNFGYSYLLYADGINSSIPNWFAQAYNGSYDYSNTEHVMSGSFAVKITLTSGFGALQIGAGSTGTPIDLSNYTALRVSVYGTEGIGDLNIVFNGDYTAANDHVITPVAGQYTVFTVPLTEFNSPAQLTEFVIQGQGNTGTFYVDNIGFLK